MGMQKLDCPVCGAMFIKCHRASKTCSYACSHKLVKREPRAKKYVRMKLTPHEKQKRLWDEIRAAGARLESRLP